MGTTERDGGDAAERHVTQEEYNQQLWYEQELDKIRTEGDIALVRAQAERQRIAEADAKIKELQRQLRDKKKQFTKFSVAAGAGIVGDSAMIEQISRRHEQVRMQLEERLKVSISAKTTELHHVRLQIDELRRRRLDGLASEKRILEETKRSEEAIKQSQAEMETLKERASQLRAEIAKLQHELDEEKREFRLERQRLQLDLDRVARPEKVAVKVKVLGRKFTVFRSMAMTRKKRDALSRAKKLSLEQKVVSFEQKKMLMDRLVQESEASTLSEFIQIYNRQEKEKAELMARIEVKSFTNASLQQAVAQLEEDITRLSGAGDIQSIVHTQEPNGTSPSDMKKRIDADEALISQWNVETHAFQDALKTFRDPIRELYLELFPLERDDETFDSTTNEITMLRRIGSIEERVMQRVLSKILREVESSPSNSSDTFKRLQRYRGSMKSKETNATAAETTPAPTVGATRALAVDAPSLHDQGAANDSDDDDDDPNDNPIVAIRSEDFRPKRTTPSQTIASPVAPTGRLH